MNKEKSCPNEQKDFLDELSGSHPNPPPIQELQGGSTKWPRNPRFLNRIIQYFSDNEHAKNFVSQLGICPHNVHF
jgi:hypothetical protein